MNKDFINLVGNEIRKQALKRGYNYPSAIIGQCILESGWGKSTLSTKYHNYFGLKCGSGWKGKSVNMTTKEEYQAGVITTIKDNFRVYNSLEDGIKGYFDFIQYSRYKNLIYANSSYDYLVRIKNSGYATDFNYVTKVYDIVIKNNLLSFDELGVNNVKPEELSKILTGDEILNKLADYVISGKYGNGETRKKNLGKLYQLVQEEVNNKLSK